MGPTKRGLGSVTSLTFPETLSTQGSVFSAKNANDGLLALFTFEAGGWQLASRVRFFVAHVFLKI